MRENLYLNLTAIYAVTSIWNYDITKVVSPWLILILVYV